MKPAHPKPGVPYLGGLGRDDMRMRPVQILVLGPLGYHVVNTTLLR
jgi:hypothetical protein